MATKRKRPVPSNAAERLAVLEAEFATHDESDQEHFSRMTTAFDSINKRLDGIEEKLNKQKGFIGGVVFVVSAVWAVAVMLLKTKFGGS
jgi:hypothetical protein